MLENSWDCWVSISCFLRTYAVENSGNRKDWLENKLDLSVNKSDLLGYSVVKYQQKREMLENSWDLSVSTWDCLASSLDSLASTVENLASTKDSLVSTMEKQVCNWVSLENSWD